MCKWEKLGVSKEVFEACEELAKAGLSDEIESKVNECDIKKADISELKCDRLFAKNIDTTSVFIDEVPLEDIISCKNKQSFFQEVMEDLTTELSDELWDIYNTSEEEQVCLECLVKYYLERSYSEGFKNGLESIRNRIDDAEEELLFEVAEAGYN